MKRLMIVLLALSPIVLSSCACKPQIEYVEVVRYVKPEVPIINPVTAYPSIKLDLWGDYAIYKAQCEAQIDRCNADKKSIIDAVTVK